jgi:beta-fructofuranosidase
MVTGDTMPRQELNMNRIGQSTVASLLSFAIFFTSNIVDAGEKLPVATQRNRTFREQLLRDPHRPGYHFVIPEGIGEPFDVNGAIFWKGRYHLFYLFETREGHCWGHISSTDLCHWRHHPTALAGDPDGPDHSMFSGCAFLDKNGVPTIAYHGFQAGMCLATSTDDHLDTWTKSPHNPVIPEVVLKDDPHYGIYSVFDPIVWLDEGHYYAALGNLYYLRSFGDNLKPKDAGDFLFLFKSDDLIHWEYLHRLYQSDRKWTAVDEDNACPEFFKLGEKDVLLFISHTRGCQYYVGTFQDERFFPETHGRMSWIDSDFFAPESLRDDQGREIMWAWIFDRRNESTIKKSGWSGTFSLPRVLTLGDDNKLQMWPPKEIEKLRYNPIEQGPFTIDANSEKKIDQIESNSLEILLEMEPDNADQFGVQVCASPDGEEKTLVYYDAIEKKLKIDTTQASLGEGPKSIESGPLLLKDQEPLELRIFVDKSVVEVFANKRQAVMRRIYPTRKDSRQVALFSQGGSTRVPRFRAWEMMPSNPN